MDQRAKLTISPDYISGVVPLGIQSSSHQMPLSSLTRSFFFFFFSRSFWSWNNRNGLLPELPILRCVMEGSGTSRCTCESYGAFPDFPLYSLYKHDPWMYSGTQLCSFLLSFYVCWLKLYAINLKLLILFCFCFGVKVQFQSFGSRFLDPNPSNT